jgi:class 3 adenylate cyclase
VHARIVREREEALGLLLAKPAKRTSAAAHVSLMATTIRAFATWWYEHRDVPREQVVDAVMDVAAASARRIGAPAPPLQPAR